MRGDGLSSKPGRLSQSIEQQKRGAYVPNGKSGQNKGLMCVNQRPGCVDIKMTRQGDAKRKERKRDRGLSKTRTACVQEEVGEVGKKEGKVEGMNGWDWRRVGRSSQITLGQLKPRETKGHLPDRDA